MSHGDEPDPAKLPPGPTSDLVLAQALERCLRAESSGLGSAERIIARQPRAAQAELRKLVELARLLESSMADIRPSEEFTRAARARLMQRIGRERSMPVPMAFAPRRRRRWKWVVRSTAGLLAAVLATTATLTASASALPGDPLYGLKQAQEELGVRLAADDQARVLALLRNADARLDETQQLLQEGRTSEAVQTAQRYDQSVERATTAMVVTLAPSDLAGRFEPLENKLGEQQQRLETIIQNAPEPARPDLRDALATTARGRALVADPKPVERALGLRQSRPVAAAPAAVPTAHTEDPATLVPTKQPTAAPTATLQPTLTPSVVVAESQDAQDEMAAQPGQARDNDESGPSGDSARVAQGSNKGSGNSGRGSSSASGRSSQAVVSNSHNDGGSGDDEAVAVQSSTANGHDGNGHGNGNGNGQVVQQDRGRGQESDSDNQDQAVITRQSANSSPAADSRGSGSSSSSNNGGNQGNGQGRGNNDSSSSGSVSARSGAVQPASQSDKAGATVSRDSRDDEARSGSGSAAAVVGGKATPTPTPNPRHAVSADDQKSGSSSGDSHGSGNGSGGRGDKPANDGDH